MRPLWYGDRRDRVKWGALVYLAKEFGVSSIVHVPYWRDDTVKVLRVNGGSRKVPIPAVVWDYFSDLANVEPLGRLVGTHILTIKIRFAAHRRREYMQKIVEVTAGQARPRLLFLDPDTGIQPPSLARAEHASTHDMVVCWNTLGPREILAVYQHALRRPRWREEKLRQFQSTCRGSRAHVVSAPDIAADVAILWAQKT